MDPKSFKALDDLLNVIEGDKDGDYFICAEAEDVVNAAYAALVHEPVGTGQCGVCGHYGSDCRGGK